MIITPHQVLLPGFIPTDLMPSIFYARRTRARRRCWTPLLPSLRSDISCIKPVSCARYAISTPTLQAPGTKGIMSHGGVQ